MDSAVRNPSKEEVRRYMQHRFTDHTPPPSLKQIRRELGWELIAGERGAKPGCHATVKRNAD